MSTYKVELCESVTSYMSRPTSCEKLAGHIGKHQAGFLSWGPDPVPAPQFKPGDRVSAEGIVREVSAQPGSTALIVVFDGADHKPLTLFPDRLTLVSRRCAALFPGRENEDPPPRCDFTDGHEGLHEDAEGWRWGTIEQRTDDAQALAEPRCVSTGRTPLGGIPVRCWGMVGHIGPHRAPTGEWT